MVLGNGRMISLWPVRGGPVLQGDVLYFAAGIWPSEGIFIHAIDPVGGKTKLVRALVAQYAKARLTRVTHRFYPEGRHEMFNDVNRDEVTTDFIAWADGLL